MSKKAKTILAVVLIAAIVLIAVGYAAISNITLTIQGTATGTGNTENFKVNFTGTPTSNINLSVEDPKATATGSITNDKEAVIAVSGLATKDDYGEVTFTVTNASSDLKADIAATVSGGNTDDFIVTTSGGGTGILPGASTTVTVRVTLNKTLVDATATSAVKVDLVATPVVNN